MLTIEIQRSCVHAQRVADEVMSPLFPEGWYRAKTKFLPIKGMDNKIHIGWYIVYDDPNRMVDFPPWFWVNMKGQIDFMSPSDLRERIKKYTTNQSNHSDHTK